MSLIAFIDKTDDLAIISNQHATTPFTYMMLWRWDDVRFKAFVPAENFLEWDQGIVFGKAAQIRWRNLASDFRAVLLTDSDEAEGWNGARVIKKQPDSGRNLFLWGEKEFDKNGNPTGSWFASRSDHVPRSASPPLFMLDCAFLI